MFLSLLFLKNKKSKLIPMPKRYILRWQSLFPYSWFANIFPCNYYIYDHKWHWSMILFFHTMFCLISKLYWSHKISSKISLSILWESSHKIRTVCALFGRRHLYIYLDFICFLWENFNFLFDIFSNIGTILVYHFILSKFQKIVFFYGIVNFIKFCSLP